MIIIPYIQEVLVQHAVKNILESIFSPSYYEHSYASIPGKGTHSAVKQIKKWIKKDPKGTKYCLKTDIRKYFDSVDQDILIHKLRKKIRDAEFLRLLKAIIKSVPKGLALGFVTSQPLANFYLTDLDHCLKEKCGAKYSIRFLDDIVIFGPNKRKLHKIQNYMSNYLNNELNLEMKANWQVFKVKDDSKSTSGRFLDFLGFKFYKKHVGIRRSVSLKAKRKTKHIFKKKSANIHDARQMVIYASIIKNANCYKWFNNHIQKYVSIKKLRKYISNYDKKHKPKRRRLICGMKLKQHPPLKQSMIPRQRNTYTLHETLLLRKESMMKEPNTQYGCMKRQKSIGTFIRFMSDRFLMKLVLRILRKL